MKPVVSHSGILVDGLIDNINRRFRYLFEYNSSSSAFVAATVAHPNFKLRWVPAEKKEWAKDVFMSEAKKCASSSLPEQSTVQQEVSAVDTFFDYTMTITTSLRIGPRFGIR